MSLEKFSNRLKQLMSEEKISRRALSARTGLQRKSILNWLAGKYYPRYDALIILAEFFNVKTDYLLGLCDENGDYLSVTIVCSKQINKQFISKINKFLEDNKMSKYCLAKNLKIGQTPLQRWFSKGSMPEMAKLIRLSRLTGESVDFLLGRE